MSIKLIACDLDGTLALHNSHISDETLAAIQRARAEGVIFVLATGRMPYVIGHYLDRLGITDEPFMGAHGALLGYRDGRMLRSVQVDPELAREATEIAKQHGAGMAYYWKDRIVVDSYFTSAEEYALWLGADLIHDPDAIDHLDNDLIKFMAIHTDQVVVPAILAEWRAHFGPRADIARSWDWFVEGTALGGDKGSGVAWLCEHLGIDRDEVLTIGDGGNDVSMLAWAKHSAAPASGDPAAIAAAKWTAPPIEQHPVAATLEKYLGW